MLYKLLVWLASREYIMGKRLNSMLMFDVSLIEHTCFIFMFIY